MSTTPTTAPPVPPQTRCTGEPVSWLRLERYHAGQLGAADKAALEQHLASCPACAACLARIREDDAALLPALPAAPRVPRAVGVLPVASTPASGKLTWLRSPSVMAAASTLAIAAAVVLGVGRGWWRGGRAGTELAARGERAEMERATVRVKGGSIGFTLVRDDDERIEGATGIYRDGDRFKVLVTCPPTFHAGFDVVVFETGAEPAFPLEPAPGLACGNLVPLPGAMRLTGKSNETVCVVWSETGGVERTVAAMLLEGGGGARGDTKGLCKELKAAP